MPPISSEVFTDKVLQARAVSTAEADKAGFEKLCTVCQKPYYSENSYRNHIGSAKHRARAAASLSRPNRAPDDEASSVMSSTFSLGDPVDTKNDVGSDAEEEFTEVIEGLKRTGLQDRTSPIKRPTNPARNLMEEQTDSPSADGQASSAATPTPSKSGASAPTLKSCLFCNYESTSVPLNIAHMERFHSLFIPERQYLVDIDGLLGSLQQRVLELNECLYCGKAKANSEAVQTHMRDKGHCQIPYSTEEEQLEIGEFYDFRSTYSDGGASDDDDDDESMEDDDEARKQIPRKAKLGAKRETQVSAENGGGGDDGWETDSTASSLDTDDLHAVPAEQGYDQFERLDKHPHHSRDDPRHHHQRDGWHSHAHKHAHAVFYDDYEMHLPSGKSVGHRSLNKYYRQNLRDHPTPEEKAEQQRLAIEGDDGDRADADAMDVDDGAGGQVARRDAPGRGRDGALVSRANGGLGMVGVSDHKKKEVRKAEVRARKVQNQANRDMEWALNRRNNHQKYYHYSIL